MKNNVFESFIQNLSATAREADVSPVDVRSRVLSTLGETSMGTSFDYASLACCGIAIIIAVTTVVMWLPEWQTVVDPWGVYFI